MIYSTITSYMEFVFIGLYNWRWYTKYLTEQVFTRLGWWHPTAKIWQVLRTCCMYQNLNFPYPWMTGSTYYRVCKNCAYVSNVNVMHKCYTYFSFLLWISLWNKIYRSFYANALTLAGVDFREDIDEELFYIPAVLRMGPFPGGMTLHIAEGSVLVALAGRCRTPGQSLSRTSLTLSRCRQSVRNGWLIPEHTLTWSPTSSWPKRLLALLSPWATFDIPKPLWFCLLSVLAAFDFRFYRGFRFVFRSAFLPVSIVSNVSSTSCQLSPIFVSSLYRLSPVFSNPHSSIYICTGFSDSLSDVSSYPC